MHRASGAASATSWTRAAVKPWAPAKNSKILSSQLLRTLRITAGVTATPHGRTRSELRVPSKSQSHISLAPAGRSVLVRSATNAGAEPAQAARPGSSGGMYHLSFAQGALDVCAAGKRLVHSCWPLAPSAAEEANQQHHLQPCPASISTVSEGASEAPSHFSLC